MLAEQGQLARLVEQNVNLKKRQGAPIGRLQAKAISRDNRSKARAKRRRWKRYSLATTVETYLSMATF